MILTITPNPSIDRTIAVDALDVGEVNRAKSARIDPGGKGVNVSRALSANGHPTRAILPLGGPDGDLLRALLTAAGVECDVVPIAGTTRTNVAIVDPDGVTTKVNEPGPTLSAAELDALSERTRAVEGASWLALCGSVPPGMPDTWLADLVANSPVRVALDTSGSVLRHAAKARPALLKPNREELAELAIRPIVTFADVLEAARVLVDDGVGLVVASLGSDGAVAVNADGWWFASAAVDQPLSTVGAGDCLLAGMLHALDNGANVQAALEVAVAWGAAAVSLPGSKVPGPDDVALVRVSTVPPPLDRKLES